MFIKIALSAAIVLGAAAMASAATKSNKIAVHRSGPPAESTVPRTPDFPTPTVRQPRAVAALAIIKTSTTGDEKSQALARLVLACPGQSGRSLAAKASSG